ncbi:MAG: hypothetical protein WC884_00285 [Candidatus Paceibacterota bacterium]
MNEGPHIPKTQEHLNKGISPIIYCVGSPKDFVEHSEDSPDTIISSQDNNFGLENVKNINWGHGNFEGENSLSAGPCTYVISGVDNSNKSSKGFGPCTGLIVAGITKTGEKVSFLSHQSSREILYDNNENFVTHLKMQLEEIKKRCEDGTIDAVILGGEYTNDDFKKKYLKVIKLLGTEIQQTLGFEPTIINGPRLFTEKQDDVFYDNKNRRVYFVRSSVNPQIGSFPASDVSNQLDKL